MKEPDVWLRGPENVGVIHSNAHACKLWAKQTILNKKQALDRRCVTAGGWWAPSTPCTITAIVRRQRAELLTLGEAWRVVVDVGELDGDGGGSGQAAKVSPHVFGLEQHQVLVLGLPVHVGHGCAQDT